MKFRNHHPDRLTRIRLNSAWPLRLTFCFLFFWLFWNAQAAAQSAGLAVGSASGSAGSTVSLPVTLTPGASPVSTLQFELVFSSAFTYANVSSGPAAAAAGKTVSANPVAGGVRVLVYGLNQNSIGAGGVASVQINISAAAAIGANPIGIRGIVASDPSAREVLLPGSAGSITRIESGDHAGPVISGVSSSNITINGAAISWTTNESADSQVQYGTTTSYGSTTALNSALATAHSQALTGLAANQRYHYRVRSRDAAGNLATSGDSTFTTRSDGPDPVISQVEVSGITGRSATIRWLTDRSSDSEVEYWADGQASARAVLGDLVTDHVLTLNQLRESTVYRFRVKSADANGNQGVSGEFGFMTDAASISFLALPRFSNASSGPQALGVAGDVMTGMALTNLGTGPADLSFTAFDGAGNLLAGPDISNPKSWSLDSRSQFGILDFEIFGDGFITSDSKGWIKLESSSPDVGGFFLTFDSGLTFMDGANFGTTPLTDFAFTEIEPDGSTRFNLANGNSGEVRVTFNLMRANGTVRGSTSRTIHANGALVGDLFGDLFTGVTPEPSDYVRVNSTVGVQPFELMQKRVGDIASLTGADITSGATTLYSPQYVAGGPWTTSLSILNLDSRIGMVTLRLISGDGVQIGESRAAAIPALGKLYIDDPEFFVTLEPGEIAAGYVEIVSDGVRISGSTVFGDRTGESFSSALPLVSVLHKNVLFSHIASNDLYFTGLAIVNPGTSTATATIELYSAGGILLASKTGTIAAKHRSSRLLTEYFPSLAGEDHASGYIRLISNSPIASFALIGTNHLSVLSAIPPQETD